MARPTYCSSGGWAASRLVGSLGRTPTIGQKQLMGKNGKSCQCRQYKKTIDVHNKQQQQQREKKENRKTSKKRKRKQKTKSKEEKYE